MRLGKKIIKLLPDSIIYVRKIERWLHDMAKEGLVLKHIHKHYAVFEKSEPQNTDYYLAAYNETYMSDERKENIKNAGWELLSDGIGVNWRADIGSFFHSQNLFYLFKKDKVNNEINEPGDELKADWLWEVISAYMKSKTFSFVFFAVILAGTIYRLIFEGNYNAFLFSIGIQFVLCAACMAVINSREVKRIEKYKQLYEKNHNTEDFTEWKASAKKNYTQSIIKLVCLLFFAYFLAGSFYNVVFPRGGRVIELSDKYITAYDIEGYGHILSEQQKQIMYEDPANTFFDDSPYIYSLPSLLAPVYYNVSDYGHAYTVDGEEISIYYKMKYCRLLFGRLNYMFFDSWVRQQSMAGCEATITINTNYFTKYAYCNSSNFTYFCMYGPHEIIYLVYSGSKTPEQVVEAIAYALNN